MRQPRTIRISALATALVVLFGAYVPARTQLRLCIGEQGHFAMDVVSHVLCENDCAASHTPVKHPDTPCHHDHPSPESPGQEHKHPPCVDLTLHGQAIKRTQNAAAPAVVSLHLLLNPVPSWFVTTTQASHLPQPVNTGLPPPDNIRLATIILLV
ncbi:MAG: hypothetical protein VCG02_11025 [Verrucomicrobiota bacterium]